MVAVLLGVIYLQQDLTQEGVQNINGALFLFLTNMTFQNAFAVINVSSYRYCSLLAIIFFLNSTHVFIETFCDNYDVIIPEFR